MEMKGEKRKERKLLTDQQNNLEEKMEKIQIEDTLCQMDCSIHSKAQDNEIRNVIMGVIGTMVLRPLRFRKLTRESVMEAWV